MNTKKLICFICLLFLVFCVDTQAQQIIKNQKPAFELSIPDNFSALPPKLIPEGWLYGFKERTGLRDEPQITIAIEKSLELTKDKTKRLELLKKRFTIAGSSVNIENFGKIKGIRVVNSVEKVKSIMLIAEFPVKNEFVQVIAGGNIKREPEIIRIFDGIILSFKSKDDLEYKFPKVMIVIMAFGVILVLLFLWIKFVGKRN